MNREQLEMIIWQHWPTRGPSAAVHVDAILAAADAYAAGDSDGVTAMRRDVLHAASAPVPDGTRR